MKSKSIVLGLISVCVICLAGCGMFGGFDAEGYVQAVLDQTFQGDVKQAAEVMEDVSRAELLEQYEKEIQAFVENNLTVGIEMEAELQAKYIKLTKDIFAAMRYKLTEAKETEGNVYEVNVEIQPSDVFLSFTEKVNTHFSELMRRVEAGEYKGTEEEINIQMQTDLIQDAYEFLEESSQEMKYNEKENVVITVKGNEDKVYSVEEEDIYNLITKILCLDQIQG